MGHYTAPNGTRSFWPDNNEEVLYVASSGYESTTFQYLIELAKEHFGDRFNIETVTIEAEHIHTNCLGYDQYDPSDYTNFFVIRQE